MACAVPNQDRVIVTKFITSGAVPIIPSGSCAEEGTREIEEAEIVVNTRDKRVFTRAGNSIIELTNQVNGAGTVSSVSVVTNQGVSGTVATATTTPAITLSLGALTGVTSLNGLVVTANTGVITTGTWQGTAIADAYISSAATWNAKVSTGVITGSGLTMSTARLLGRTTALTGAIEEITVGSGLTFAAGTLSATGGSAISALTAAAATNSIDNTNYVQDWAWNTLAGGEGLYLQSSSTAAATNTQTLFKVSLSGANAAIAQTTYAAYISNTHTNATSGTNVGAYINASGITGTNTPLWLGMTNSQYIRFDSTTTSKAILFDNGAGADGMYFRNLMASPNTLDLIGAGANPTVVYNIKGGTVGNTLLSMQAGGASNVSYIAMYRGTTETIRLIDNNSNDSYHNTGKSFCIGTTAAGTSAANCLVLKSGTAPTAAQTDLVHVYSADISAGNAALHIENENGESIKLYRVNSYTQTYATAARTVTQPTGIDNLQAGNVYASVADLQSLVQVVNGLIDDLQTVGVIG